VVVRENNFSKCRDGVLYSGGTNLYQSLEFCNNTVLCIPPRDTHSGYTWLSLQRPVCLPYVSHGLVYSALYVSLHMA
jgi:hypothetical protein